MTSLQFSVLSEITLAAESYLAQGAPFSRWPHFLWQIEVRQLEGTVILAKSKTTVMGKYSLLGARSDWLSCPAGVRAPLLPPCSILLPSFSFLQVIIPREFHNEYAAHQTSYLRLDSRERHLWGRQGMIIQTLPGHCNTVGFITLQWISKQIFKQTSHLPWTLYQYWSYLGP